MNPIEAAPMLASGALQFAFERATTEGKITIFVLVIVSLFSWTVFIKITKFRQSIAPETAKKFLCGLSCYAGPARYWRAAETV